MRTRSGAMASIIDVSVSPAWASPPATRGHHDNTLRPSVWSTFTARSTGMRLPPCPFTSTTPPLQSALRTSSTMTCSKTDVPMLSVPGNPACSPLALIGERRRHQHVALVVLVGQSLGQRAGDADVGVEGEVRTVLLARPDGYGQDGRPFPAPVLGPRRASEMTGHVGSPRQCTWPPRVPT